MNIFDIDSYLTEKWSAKYKRSIDCSHPKGFSQRAHCQSVKKKRTNENIERRVDPDEVLTKLCTMVVRGQEKDADRYGMVAAAIIDPEGNHVYGINLPGNDGKRRHAERVAIENYRAKHGDIPKDTICVTTCSPCNRDSDEREGGDCYDLLKSAGINEIYCGYKDPSQDDNEDVVVTDNNRIKELCKEFASTWLNESCRYGQYYCSTDKKLKCRQGPKQKRQVKESIDIESFLPYVIKELGIKHLPKIEIVDQVPGTDGKTFGRYDPEKETVYVVSQGRHERDVMRTLAHELVHYQQDQEQRLKHDSGATGSSEENEANARAGVIMRNYNGAEPMSEDIQWSADNNGAYSQKNFYKIKQQFENDIENNLSNVAPQESKEYSKFTGLAKRKVEQIVAKLEGTPKGQALADKLTTVTDKLIHEGWSNTTLQTVVMAVLMAALNRLVVAVDVNVFRLSAFAITVSLEAVLPSVAAIGYTLWNGGDAKTAVKNAVLGGGIGSAAALASGVFSENFADGKHPGRKGLAKRMGVPTKASVSKLRDIAKHSTGEKARMAHWCANMKSGRKKK